MLTDLRLGYVPSTVRFSKTSSPMYAFNSTNENYWHEDDGRMSYCYKSTIDYRFMVLETWCGIPKGRQSGGKLKAPSQVPFF